MIGIILQARMGSTRFRGKTLKKIFKNFSILEIILTRLKMLDIKIIVATTNKKEDKRIIDTALKYNISYYCGDENNVLKRFIDCAKEYNITKIIRICGDNIFIQPEFIIPFKKYSNSNFDYMSFRINNQNTILTHWGLFGEYITLDALKKIQKKTKSKKDLEHITYYIYTHPNEFNIKYLDVPQDLKRNDIRLTIDTIEDFKICRNIIKYLDKNNLCWNYENILEYINSNQLIIKKMSLNIIKNEKG